MAIEDEDRAAREFAEGIENITRALVDAAESAGVRAAAEDVTINPPWERGRPIPQGLRFTLAALGAPAILVDFSREQVEDCWRSLERPDVRQILRDVAKRFTQMQRK